MLKRIGTGMVFVAALAAAGAMFVAKAAPERAAGLAPPSVPAGNKPFARICKSDEVIDARPTPAWVRASFARDNCRAPSMPATIDGFTASREQIVAGMAAAERYAVASDAFERCVQDFVAARKAQEDRNGKPANMSVAIIENHRVIASQRNKQIVSARMDAAIHDFNEYGSGCPS
jgi:hypothetical protein